MIRERVEGLVSIIIPVYNIDMYINKCILSVVNQSYKNLEIIVIDDGSTDFSAAICDSWSKRDSRIRVIHQKNSGISASRNIGIEMAQGQFIMYIDGDDYISPQLCEKLVETMQETNADCCVCGWNDVATTGDVLKSYTCDGMETLSGKDAIRKLYVEDNNHFNLIVAWGKLYRWDLWEKIRYTDGIYYEDMDIMPLLYLGCSQIVRIPYLGYNYLQRTGSMSNGIGHDDKRYTDSLTIRIKHIWLYLENNEVQIARVNMGNLMDLIITSDIKGWIPKGMTFQSKKIFWTYLFKYTFVEGLTADMRGRYFLYAVFGRRLYILFVKFARAITKRRTKKGDPNG